MSYSSGSALDAIAHPGQINLLADYQGAANTANAINQNRLFQAQQARGQALQQAIDPQTGRVDPLAYNRLVASSPQAALAAPDAVNQSQNLTVSQQDVALKNVAAQRAALGALQSANDGTGPTYQQVIQQLQMGVQQGWLQPAGAGSVLTGMPTGDDPQSMATRKHMIQIMDQQTLDAQQRLMNAGNAPASIDNGQQIQPGGVGGQLSPTPNAFTPAGGPIQKLTGPETNAAMVTVSDGAGNSYLIPRSSLPGASGVTPGLQPGQTSGTNTAPGQTGGAGNTPATAVQTPAQSVLGTGRVPNALRNPAATPPATSAAPMAPGTTPQPGAAPPGATLTAVSPATDVENKGAAEHAVAARDMANSYQARIQPIEGALNALAGADTGKGAEVLNTIRAYSQDVAPRLLQTLIPPSLLDTQKRVLFDEANKYLTGMALGVPGAAGSDARLGAAGAATPSVHISNEAAQLVARATLAQQRLTQSGTLAFNASGQPGQNYDRFMNTWNTQADPRAFIADKMTPIERQDLVKSMGGIGSAAYQKFKQSYQAGVAAGVIPNHAAQ